MDLPKVLLSVIILSHVPFSERGLRADNLLASGTIISISTSKGNIILKKEGKTTSVLSSSLNVPVTNTKHRRWNHHETALSNTFPLEVPQNNASFTTSFTLTTTTTAFTTPETPEMLVTASSVVEPDNDLWINYSTHQKGRNIYAASTSTKNPILDKARQYQFPDGNPFHNNTSSNMTVPLGDTAFLRCKARNLGERSISWIRRRDWHILSTMRTTYTNDERFHVLHADGSEDWTLQIKFVQKRDNGTYECQVSTGTGIISYFVNLFIAVPEAFILGNGEYHVEERSTIILVCVIEKSPKPPEFMFWYHNERMINYGNSREVVVKNEPGARTQSRLTIHDARIADSGNYTCKTAHAEPASILVYVSQASGLYSGDKMAAIQRRKTGGGTISLTSGESKSSKRILKSMYPISFSLALCNLMVSPF